MLTDQPYAIPLRRAFDARAAAAMSFLAPLFLLLGARGGVPLLLHLLRRNIATRVDFPAARYLQRAEQEHSRSLRLRNLLLMLLRVLLVLALALAAARPFLRGLGVGHGADRRRHRARQLALHHRGRSAARRCSTACATRRAR